MATRPVVKALASRGKTLTSLDIDREAFEKNQITSITKAINTVECPVKQKHVRVILIGTHQEQSAAFFRNIVRRIGLEENPIVCWKFCHVLHKVLRDGHRKAIIDSYQFRGKIVDLGKFWFPLREGYGRLIHAYCKLLICKIDFHARNQSFPGNLQVTDVELDKIGESDVNVFFQLTVEMFDYLDDILNLQSVIFGSFDMSRANSMTTAGQCRLAPLIPCIQDSSCLYDYCVKVLFKLHAVLPPTTLEGHRNRFLQIFKRLKQFYINSSHLQYFKNLIQVPTLPENPPNFLHQSDLRDYVSPVVRVRSDESPEGSEAGGTDTLVDLSIPRNSSTDASSEKLDTISIRSFPSEHSSANGFGSIIEEKNRMINKLMAGINELHMENQHRHAEYERALEKMRKHILDLEANRVEQDRLINTLNIEKESAMREVEELRAELERHKKGTDFETELAKVQQNYTIMKDAYAKMRGEHLELIRSKADLEKQMVSLKSQLEELKLEKEKRDAEACVQLPEIVENDDDVPADIGDQLKQELSEMETAIMQAAKRIEDLSAASKQKDTGIKLEVNEKILDSCTDLISAIMKLILDSKALQEEIISSGKDSTSSKDFYQRNYRWTEGLISAAKVVALAAKLLVDAADKVISGKTKFSELVAASNEIAAATAQLVVASRVKADRKSEKLTALSLSSKKVTECTGNVVATAKLCAEKVDSDTSNLDFSKMSLTQAKRLEFESQTRVIELKCDLEKELEKLASLRKQHYHLAGVSEGWEPQ